MMWWGGPGFDGGGSFIGMGLMMLFMTLFAIGVIVLIVWLVVGASRGAGYGGMQGMPPGGHGDPAMEEARRRFARGEITREQYEEIVSTLGRR